MTGFDLAVWCLALNVYHEAAYEPIEGRYAVAFVTMNRTVKRDKDVCGVVFEHKQFSWANNALDEKRKIKKEFLPKGPKWEEAKQVARRVLNFEVRDFTGGADHYHADYIRPPKWAKSMVPLSKIGRHQFMRCPINPRPS